jgi:hypothetical protein
MAEERREEPAVGGGRVNKSAQKIRWKEVYSIAHFKQGDKTAIPKTITILEDENGTLYLSAKDESNKVVIKLDDDEASQLMIVLQARLLKKAMER